MLHPFREASCRRIPSQDDPAPGGTPARDLLILLAGIRDWLETDPAVHRSQEGQTVYIFYRNAAFLIDDFWDAFGVLLADIQQSWTIAAYGTAQNQETVRLAAEREAGAVRLVEQSISGHSTDVLETLCLQVDCPDGHTAEALARLLAALRWNVGVAAVPWEDAEFLRRQGLFLWPDSRGMFCYAGIDPAVTAGDCLLALDFSQKVSLWAAFLKEGWEPTEWEWLAEEIANGRLVSRMEWELALREALHQLHFTLVNQERSFELFDGDGRRLYVGADCHRVAERALLKILFPLHFP